MKNLKLVRQELAALGPRLIVDNAAWMESHARSDKTIVDRVSGETICVVYLAPRWRAALESAGDLEALLSQLDFEAVERERLDGGTEAR